MPLGFARLNERSQRPNTNINFIKPLDSPDRATAQQFLERIAAQCYPVMKKNYISVMALEEYPPNPEFLGRNFNAGEVIQLVLKDKQGRWLSLKFVQMVMMHELAHCKQMNHSRAFWGVRNGYAEEMKGLWGRGYTGEGLWGRGKDLATGAFVHDRAPESGDVPEHLCGGTYRRARGRKRKRGAHGQDAAEKPKVSYAERQQKRIARKFGSHGEGNAVGDDELLRGALETRAGTKRGQGKPKVAQSKRGRELRASAALARFEAAKVQQKKGQEREAQQTPDLQDDEGSETESGSDWEPMDDIAYIKSEVNIGEGPGLIRVCGDEDGSEEGAEKEMDELRMMSGKSNSAVNPTNAEDRGKQHGKVEVPGYEYGSETASEPETLVGDETATVDSSTATAVTRASSEACTGVSSGPHHDCGLSTSQPDYVPTEQPQSTPTAPSYSACPICSLENDSQSLTCVACAHVLRPSLMKNHWCCASEACQGSKYINAGDAGRCGLCGTQNTGDSGVTATDHDRRVSTEREQRDVYAPGERAMGLTRGEVLRWD